MVYSANYNSNASSYDRYCRCQYGVVVIVNVDVLGGTVGAAVVAATVVTAANTRT